MDYQFFENRGMRSHSGWCGYLRDCPIPPGEQSLRTTTSWSPPVLVQPCRAEAQSIGDDRKGTEAHRSAGDDRTEEHAEERVEHACRDWDASAL